MKIDFLIKMFPLYKSSGGKLVEQEEDFIYLITRKSMIRVYRNLERGNLNVNKIDEEIVRLLLFGTTEDFESYDCNIKLDIPPQTRECLRMYNRNVRGNVTHNGKEV